MIHAWLGAEPIDPCRLAELVTGDCRGALVTFVGTVRDTADGRAVTRLEYSAYFAMALAEMNAIVSEASMFVLDGAIGAEHRIGTLEIGEVAVAIAVSDPHREAAFYACRYVIEQIKRRVPIWKREHYADGESEWVRPDAHDDAPDDLPPAHN